MSTYQWNRFYVFSLLLRTSLGQIFSALPFDIPIANASGSCSDALNTTVSCPAFLGSVSFDNPMLELEQSQALCVDSCRQSLNSVRKTIQRSCTATSDVIEFDGVAYPPTFVADHFLFTWSLSCRKDTKTNQFCDEVFRAWQSDPQSAPNETTQDCSDCILGLDQVQLNSPFGYDEEYAEYFSSKTASCEKSSYGFTVPSAYAISTNTVPSATSGSSTAKPTQSCVSNYIVKEGDTCNTVARENKISTFNLLYTNGLAPDCRTFPEPGASLCIPAQCDTYTVEIHDSCTSIVDATDGVNAAQLLAWNPNINTICGNILGLVGHEICVSPPGGDIGSVQATSSLAVSIPLAPTARPTNANDDTIAKCGRWYTIQEGDYCDKVSIHESIALADFRFLNPEINADCTNLLLGLAYCVQAVGDISTYSGYPRTTNFITLTSPTYSTSTPNATQPHPAPEPTLEPELPLASDTLANCYAYRDYQSYGTPFAHLETTLNSCNYVANINGVTIANLVKWNPSLSAEACSFHEGLRYCVIRDPSDTIIDFQGDTQCETIEQPMQGTINTCGCFTVVHGYEGGDWTCAAIADDYGITVDQLQHWNPWVGSDCDTGLYADLAENDQRGVCIAVNASVPTATAGPGPSGSSPTSGASAGPTQTGIAEDCSKYYTIQSGDTCASVGGTYALTFEEFYALNPAVGPQCGNLWLGYAYCVAAPSANVPSATIPAQPTSPVRTGTTSDCSAYYTVQSGDSCQKIQDLFDITFAQLYAWNSDIGSDCENLWVGYAICVDGTS